MDVNQASPEKQSDRGPHIITDPCVGQIDISKAEGGRGHYT